jgi:hypothetical protein
VARSVVPLRKLTRALHSQLEVQAAPDSTIEELVYDKKIIKGKTKGDEV